MTYELCNELKEAGFPQKDDRALFEAERVSYPTLEELIEACGEGFRGLVKGHFLVWSKEKRNYEDFSGFFAGALDGEDGSTLYVTYEPHGFGSTPSEAVARLWLALNKKDEHSKL